jgi:hypothetical protein
VQKVDKSADKAATSTGKLGTQSKAASGKLRSAASSAKGFVLASAGIMGAQQVVGDAIGNAVNLGEQMSKTAVVFRGPGAKSVQDWSKTTATALGMSQRQALEATGTFGNMLVPMGFGRKRAAEDVEDDGRALVDMASFNNASPEETLDAVRAGLAGETEPLRRFGIFLSDARLKQQAMSMGLYKGKGVLDANAKAQATYALILKDSKDAQGDFARTSDSLANQQRVLKAQYEQLTATLGKQLLPALSWMVKNLPTLAIIVGSLATAWGIWTVTSAMATAGTLSLSGAFGALSAAMLANPVGVVLIALVALGAGLVIAYRKVDWFRNGVDAAFKWVKQRRSTSSAGSRRTGRCSSASSAGRSGRRRAGDQALRQDQGGSAQRRQHRQVGVGGPQVGLLGRLGPRDRAQHRQLAQRQHALRRQDQPPGPAARLHAARARSGRHHHPPRQRARRRGGPRALVAASWRAGRAAAPLDRGSARSAAARRRRRRTSTSIDG